MAAVFGAPLASVTLAVELLLFEFSARSLVPLVTSASIAAGVHAAFFGSGPLFHVPPHDYAGLGSLWVFAAFGAACGVLAALVVRGLFFVEAAFRRLPFTTFWHPMIGALGFAAVGLLVPRALGVGYESINDVLANKLAAGTLAVLLLAKLVAWWIALGSGTSGGTLAPILFISGCFGGLAGALVHGAFPGVGISAGAVALVAMAATFGAATRATFTAIVFAFELTRDYRAIVPLMLAAVLADLVAGALLPESIMTEKLARRGLRVPRGYEPDALSATMVREVMTRDVKTLSVDATDEAVQQAFATGHHSAYPLVDRDGRCVGIVTRGDILAGTAVTAALSDRDLVTAAPDDSLLTAHGRMPEEHVDHLPVVDHTGLIGICTRTDVLHARGRRLHFDRPQLGWMQRRNGKAGTPPTPIV
jgi:CBS domain-containing protein